jgi:hypothetical protein
MYLDSGANGGLVTRMTLKMINWLAQKSSWIDRELMPRNEGFGALPLWVVIFGDCASSVIEHVVN